MTASVRKVNTRMASATKFATVSKRFDFSKKNRLKEQDQGKT